MVSGGISHLVDRDVKRLSKSVSDAERLLYRIIKTVAFVLLTVRRSVKRADCGWSELPVFVVGARENIHLAFRRSRLVIVPENAGMLLGILYEGAKARIIPNGRAASSRMRLVMCVSGWQGEDICFNTGL